MRDQIFSKKTDLVDFTFDAQVADVFDDMVRRSVPGYQTLIEMLGLLVRTYSQDNTNYYDLGASTGAVSLALGINRPHKNNRIIAVDNSVDMVEKCKSNLDGKITNFDVICSDIKDICFDNASIVVLNLTLQFIIPEQRQTLINKIHQGLNPGGVLVVSEKIHFDDAQKQAKITRLHLDFKRANGYSELEIATKRQSIENVLITDNQQTHFERFKTAGFSQSICHFQCLNFASFLAVK
ncbi:carboxy-S-adenosyl-L-methionine synthase CmoA [uncultured Candidatus Thioglobus sp.]|jgi:tRNA (cmo5U34)-methyltransferase|uniref:carboxy-S-adenosyl-L-methionine synthase CmoA n=1 Tax=uncultured Candidatus Thioglobus sp. TaxID=655186 RepID=UPI0001BD379D|nr:MAG: SAM-dependent methyltransferase [uncultured Candidatus Thioglobus sp.]MBT3432244.1 carboxy-S-adenosyl-L-methionine synthase CmoA [Candidatus Thioglobus sp.]MBT4316403.1 carboxy-S-adenosyl-L-methionine synthase CmoA [Candidatus Thioglobus sp.]MBT5784058.1 carboxy-S-adenosyl-L-methionine synthase CmoA [Candidatus Thioglobus sp.]MBT7002564.1 carboxy-S-adenosyl-L-methionine synthase CmoA [Candidatus Thioglobus sp.]